MASAEIEPAAPPELNVGWSRVVANVAHLSRVSAYRPLIAPLKAKGDLAEVMIAADLIRRGYKIAIPYGED